MTAFTRHAPIRFAHCDAAGLIFYPQFFGLVNEAVEDWFEALGYSFRVLHVEQKKGVPTAHIEAEFMRPVRLGDVLQQHLSVAHLGRTSCQLKHEAIVSDEIVARFDQVIVYADLATMNPEPWPSDLRDHMTRYLQTAAA